jgi:hypothetical protein
MPDCRSVAGGLLTSDPQRTRLTVDRLDRLAGWIGAFTVIATLANGSGFFLRRIGLLDHQAYRRDLLTFCTQPIQELWLPASCHFRKVLSLQPLRVLTLDSSRLYEIAGPELLLKLAKYGVLGGLIVLSLLLILRRQVAAPRWAALFPAVPLAISILVSLGITAHQSGIAVAFASLLSVAWVPLLALAGWLTTPTRLHRLANAIAALMLVQLPLALVEAMRGLPTSFGSLAATLHPPDAAVPSRLAQTFILPNSLGVFAVCALAFCISFSRHRRWLPWLYLATLPPILLARSAAGTITLLGLVALPTLERLRHRYPLRRHLLLWAAGSAAMGGLLTLGLPRLLGRPDLLQSLTGRLGQLVLELTTGQPFTLLFGQGLAAAGNRISELLSNEGLLRPLVGGLWPAARPSIGPSDSMVVLLLVQGGILAVAAFYGLLLRAMVQDRNSRPFLLSVLLCSLTLNVTELFPIDLLLALALCRSLQTTTTWAGTHRLSRWLRPLSSRPPALPAPWPSQG